jgi:hypothetical protein
MHNLGAPIVCAEYDLEEALIRANAARMAREDSGSVSDDDQELEDATPLTASPSTSPSKNQQPTPPPPMALGRLAKKKEDKRRKQRGKRKMAALASLSSTTPPAPTPRVLEKVV